MKIVFFGTANVALPILEKLHQHHEIVAVVTTPDKKTGREQSVTESPVSVLANEMELKVLKPERVKNNQEFLSELKNLGADIFIVVAYGKILPSDIINLPAHKTLNVHFSLLPKYRGASPLQAALLNGDTETGTTIIQIDEQLDHGPVVAQEKFPIDADDNFITLSEKLAAVSAKLLFNTLFDYSEGKLELQTQDESQASVTKIISKEDGKIDWNKSAQQIYNQFRAYYPWPGIWAAWNGKLLKIADCIPSPAGVDAVPGTVSANGIISCGSSTGLQIKSLQLEGKTETDIKSFLNGYKDFVGSKLA